MERFLAFVRFMHTGGPINWVIAGLYVMVLAVFSERLIYFFRTRYKRDQVFRSLESGPLPDIGSLFLPAPLSQPVRMARCFLENQGETEPVQSEILDREAALIQEEMERGLGLLSFAGTVGPLLGLLGTITGLMSAFSQIEKRGSSVDISFLSGGIWEAMITTATGLITAICALSCCKWFEHLSASRLQDMSFAVSILNQKTHRRISAGSGDLSGGAPAREIPTGETPANIWAGKQEKENA
jgi:biopolymer transport protein ExbB